jgi:hypothetical protein
MNQKRVVLDDKHLPLAESILDKTGITNCSQLFAILLVNYGEKLVNALKQD